MTKLLILAYDFPPYISVAGLRPFSWYKYLHLYNVYPIVITRQYENKFENNLDYIAPGYSKSVDEEVTSTGTIIKTPFEPHLGNRIFLKFGENKFKIIRKLITAYYEFLQFILPIGTKKEIYSAADNYLKHNKVDCIIATGEPFILFKYASKLSKKYSIPWIADYRDPWIQDKNLKNKFYKTWCSFFGKKFLKKVYRITTVQPSFQKQIEQNISGKKFEIIYNGYDPEIIKATSGIKQSNNTLSIAFAGTIYDWHPINSFLNVCNELLAEDADFKLKLSFYGIGFYGNDKEKEIKEMLSKHYQFLEPHTYFHPKMDNIELAKSIAEHNVCLLFNDYSIVGTKIFDYFAVKRKVILCYENDENSYKLKKEYYCINEIESESTKLQAEIINSTNLGIVINDSQHLKSTLRELSNEIKEKGFVECPPSNIDKYSRMEQARALSKLIKEIG